ncbi:MAG: SDR family NAD(P)-dependent oxidoreductase [Actinomycetota bacterium]|nr:SDR family NAD(P)-dependent oxidoreductase [Actinomycetota bacterium]
MELAGRVALVTGASSGIGHALAVALARREVQVKATGRDDDALERLSSSTGAEALSADLRDSDAVERVSTWARPVDILVNNAGLGWAGSFGQMTPHDIEELIRVNLTAAVRLTRTLLPEMIDRGVGRVVNVSSIAGHVGVGHEAVYTATKAALIAFSDSLRYELAGTGVGVTVVSPGVVDTPFFARAGRRYTRSFPKMIKPERVASAIVRALERDAPEIFVPGWMVLPARLRGSWPALYRRLASRFGSGYS